MFFWCFSANQFFPVAPCSAGCVCIWFRYQLYRWENLSSIYTSIVDILDFEAIFFRFRSLCSELWSKNSVPISIIFGAGFQIFETLSLGPLNHHLLLFNLYSVLSLRFFATSGWLEFFFTPISNKKKTNKIFEFILLHFKEFCFLEFRIHHITNNLKQLSHLFLTCFT